MVMLKLSRVGKNKQPEFRVVVVDKRRDPYGKVLDTVGFYNPRSKPKIIRFNAERVTHWLSKGAQATPTIWNLLVDQKIVQGKKKPAHSSAKKTSTPTS